jgi:hypothetical protein
MLLNQQCIENVYYTLTHNIYNCDTIGFVERFTFTLLRKIKLLRNDVAYLIHPYSFPLYSPMNDYAP